MDARNSGNNPSLPQVQDTSMGFECSQPPDLFLRKSQESEAREYKISEMWAKIQNWEAIAEEMNLRTERAEARAADLVQQLKDMEERAKAAEAYISQSTQPTPSIGTSRGCLPAFDPQLPFDAFTPDADSSMRNEAEVTTHAIVSDSAQDKVLTKGKEREQIPVNNRHLYNDADDDDQETDEDRDADAAMNTTGIEFSAASAIVPFGPMKFPKSIIGAGPALRLRTTHYKENIRGSTSTSMFGRTAEDLSPEINMGSGLMPSSTLEQAVIALTGCVTRLTEKISYLPHSGVDPAERKKKYGNPRPRTALFKLPPQRHTTPERNDQLRAVREIMNTLLNIQHDADIVRANQVDEAVIAAHEEERGPGPTPPYAPAWGNIEGPWNYALLEIFMEAYTAKYIIRNEEQQEDICKMFMDRLRRLKKRVNQANQIGGETEVQMNQRLLTRHRIVLANQRRNSRRNERYAVRSRITVQNAASQKGDGRVVWEHLDEIVATLGAGGMSSDESDVDDDGQKVYFVKKMSWRRLGLVSRMISVDRDRNFKNCYENIVGNGPSPRKRRINATETSRRPIPGLPVNFYNDGWYGQLSEAQKKQLGAKPALDLIEFERVEG
ncbi:hypothetical protein GALMADRAFT_138565 [Galerina marginata CBS 339.88]|uniref:Uncharacterized protein n=1 Tax=Galerina marginata (strain CBS 339.88) TaxID=685588 RepID=A0A067TET8_GALM3|nr:hypothetical protein GALMADRAFT_138565 [Galerina marginata CBS 339.88]